MFLTFDGAGPPLRLSKSNRAAAVPSSESDESWSADYGTGGIDNDDEYSDKSSDLMGPAPRSMLDEDVDR